MNSKYLCIIAHFPFRCQSTQKPREWTERTITVISIAPGIELFVAPVIIAVATVFIYLICHANDWDVYRWNNEPIDVDAKPDRVWDWGDIQVLTGIR